MMSEPIDRLAREPAGITVEPSTTAIPGAREERLARFTPEASDPDHAERIARLREMITGFRERAVLSGAARPTKEEYDALWEV